MKHPFFILLMSSVFGSVSAQKDVPVFGKIGKADIDFGYQQEYSIYGNYTIPGNYIFEELPQNISLIMPDNSIVFKRFISADNNSLNV